MSRRPRLFDPHRRNTLAGIAVSVGAMAGPGRVQAQGTDYPNRVIKLVPFGSAGGPIDIIARMYADRLVSRWGQPVIVEAKPGASGILAADMVAKAPPDGYTVMVTLSLTHINNAIIQPKLPYDPVRDFEPLSQLATGSPLFATRAGAPFTNLREFVDWAKGRPNVTYATWGVGSTAHLFGELIKRQWVPGMVHVAYKAEAAAHADLFGGSIDVSWANPATARTHIQAGRMQPLGAAGNKRTRTLPNVPTFAEQGFPGFEVESWIGAYTTGKTPQPVVDKLVAAFQEITRVPEVQARLLEMGFDPLGNGPREFMAGYKADYPRMAELITAAGVTAN